MAQENGEHGHAAYGLRMSAMWEELIALAEERFKAVNVNYRTPRCSVISNSVCHGIV